MSNAIKPHAVNHHVMIYLIVNEKGKVVEACLTRKVGRELVVEMPFKDGKCRLVRAVATAAPREEGGA